MYEEIDRIFDDDKTRPVTYSDIEKMVYTEACIKETLRIMPVVPFLYKRALKDDTVGDLNWKTNQDFFINIHYIHHNKAYWPDPESFIPERFLNNVQPEENSYIPFGGGIRICPGRQMGMNGVKTFFALMLRKYDVELVNPDEPLKKLSSL
ncbi:11904_t:CDS:1, partial [Racocetra persica]